MSQYHNHEPSLAKHSHLSFRFWQPFNQQLCNENLGCISLWCMSLGRICSSHNSSTGIIGNICWGMQLMQLISVDITSFFFVSNLFILNYVNNLILNWIEFRFFKCWIEICRIHQMLLLFKLISCWNPIPSTANTSLFALGAPGGSGRGAGGCQSLWVGAAERGAGHGTAAVTRTLWWPLKPMQLKLKLI